MFTRHSRIASHTRAASCSVTPMYEKEIWATHEVVTPKVMRRIYPISCTLGDSSPKMKEKISTTTGVDALIIWMNATLMYRYAVLEATSDPAKQRPTGKMAPPHCAIFIGGTSTQPTAFHSMAHTAEKAMCIPTSVHGCGKVPASRYLLKRMMQEERKIHWTTRKAAQQSSTKFIG